MHLCCCRLLFKVGRSKASEGQDCTGSDSLLVQAYLSPWMCTCIQINGNFAIKFHILSGTTQRVTSAYHPHANGLVECQNRTIQRSWSMSVIICNFQNFWTMRNDLFLPQTKL